MPGGPSGVRLKFHCPNRCAWADSFGLTRDPRYRFNVIWVCSRRPSHSFSGNESSVLCTSQDGYEVVLPGRDCAFGAVATVAASRCELLLDSHRVEKILNFGRNLVIEALVLWPKSALGELCMYLLVCVAQRFSTAAWHWHCEDCVAVVTVYDHDV